MTGGAPHESEFVVHDFETLAEAIGSIDAEVQRLIQQRSRHLLGFLNARPGEPALLDRYQVLEAQCLRDVSARKSGPVEREAMQRIFREIAQAGRELIAPARVSFLGPEGTYSHAAAEIQFGHEADMKPETGIADIFRSVEVGRADYGVVPVENSTEGSVNHTLDLLMDTSLKIRGELRLRIQHCLLGQRLSGQRLSGQRSGLEQIRSVHAHPQALAQCRRWLDNNLPDAERISAASNAAAARHARNTPDAAAIAGQQAAELYELETLVAGIEDAKTNTTRFIVIGKHGVPPSGNDSTSLLISAPNKPGGLRRLLRPFDEAAVSLSRIESRPGRTGLWEYVFFIDVAGHHAVEPLAGVLERLSDEAPLLRVLGSYPSPVD